MNPLRMPRLLPELVEALGRHGVEHAEVRQVELEQRTLLLGHGAPPRVRELAETGWAFRVICDGAWGFAAAPALGPDIALQAAARAVALARTAAAHAPTRTLLAEQAPERGEHCTVLRGEDPLALPVECWLELLAGASPAPRAGLRLQSELTVRRTRTRLLTATGTDIRREVTLARLRQSVVAEDAEHAEPLLHGWAFAALPAAGWVQGGLDELLAGRDLAAQGDRLLQLAGELSSAPRCPPAPARTVILAADALAPLLLGTLVRSLEVDRVLGEENAASGASFLGPSDLRSSRIASPAVSLRLVGDEELPGSPGCWGWDDEGTPCRAQPLVEQGMVAGFLSSREAASLIEEATPSGCMRAAGWRDPPLVRPGSLLLSPSDPGGTLEELVADTPDGLLIQGCRGFACDGLGLTFRLAGELAWEIAGGKRRRLLRQPVIRGATPPFWARCQELGGHASLQLLGLDGRGKGVARLGGEVGLLLPPARFHPVEVIGR
ncbi:MAG: hypothetical protein FJ125_06520 [Deltaproteobacteria bacterium]|nr:hypothetical protein [Deltaproteobacteria bacterium]